MLTEACRRSVRLQQHDTPRGLALLSGIHRFGRSIAVALGLAVAAAAPPSHRRHRPMRATCVHVEAQSPLAVARHDAAVRCGGDSGRMMDCATTHLRLLALRGGDCVCSAEPCSVLCRSLTALLAAAGGRICQATSGAPAILAWAQKPNQPRSTDAV